MIMRLLSVVAAVVLAPSLVLGQQGGGRGGPVGIAAAFQNNYNGLKPSTMAEVKTYGQVIGHVADAQFNQCAGALGMPNPNQGNSFEAVGRTRAEILKGLADSFALCDKAFAMLTDENASELIAGGRGGQQARAAGLLGVIAHGNEMYGIYTVYQRAQNIVPPSTAARGRGRGGRGN